MSKEISVNGTCKYHGNQKAIEAVLKKWKLDHLLHACQEGEFTLDGMYSKEANDLCVPIEEDDLVACLREIAKAVELESFEFRCQGPGWDSAYDIIDVVGDFLVVPLELQPTLEALDDPGVRTHYGLDYCVSKP